MSKKNVLIIGGDGYIGWPVALRLKNRGHNVIVYDNLSKRKWRRENNMHSLVPIALPSVRSAVSEISFFGQSINFTVCDELVRLIETYSIDTILHLGELRSAPYSMAPRGGRETFKNNTSMTNEILSAIVDTNPTIHLVHIGTMGVYGYNDNFGEIPEGYLDVTVKSTGKDATILYPSDPGSIYHMTKVIDQTMFQFYNKNWGTHITDLHQGVVWGSQTPETKSDSDDHFLNVFEYDHYFGTVLNRFIAQSLIDHPLTVYGTGEQTRAFIHINDSVECVCLAIENKPTNEKVRIINQMTETATVNELAQYVSHLSKSNIEYLPNPRNEPSKNNLEVSNKTIKNLGLKNPTLFSADNIYTEIMTVNTGSPTVDPCIIYPTVKWS